MRIPYKSVLAVAMLGILAGCAAHEVNKTIAADKQAVAELRQRMDESKKTGAVVRYKGVDLVGDEVRVVRGPVDPAWMAQSYVYVTPKQSFQEILSTLSHDIGVPIEAVDAPVKDLSGQAQGADGLHLTWRGNVKGFLNNLALRVGLYWKYENGRVLFFREDTRSFHVFLPSAKSALSASISLSGAGGGGGGGSASGGGGGGSSGGGGGGTGNVSVSSSMEVNVYDDLIKTINAMVNSQTAATAGASASGKSGGSDRVTLNPSLGLITVTAAPPVLDRVAAYVDAVNDRFARNVMIGVKVYNLSLKEDANAGFRLNDIAAAVGGKWNYNLRGAPIMDPANGSPGTLVIERDSVTGNRGTTMLLQALSQYGDVSLVTSGQVIAANGQPAPLQVGSQVSYLASSSTTSTANAGVTTTLTPGVQSVGFTANFLPMILGDNRILLQYQINLSSLLSLDQVSSNGAVIQTPNIATQALQQQAFVKDGQSIVLFGFESGRNASSTSHGMTGISRNASSNRQMMVIVMEVFSGER